MYLDFIAILKCESLSPKQISYLLPWHLFGCLNLSFCLIRPWSDFATFTVLYLDRFVCSVAFISRCQPPIRGAFYDWIHSQQQRCDQPQNSFDHVFKYRNYHQFSLQTQIFVSINEPSVPHAEKIQMYAPTVDFFFVILCRTNVFFYL